MDDDANDDVPVYIVDVAGLALDVFTKIPRLLGGYPILLLILLSAGDGEGDGDEC